MQFNLNYCFNSLDFVLMSFEWISVYLCLYFLGYGGNFGGQGGFGGYGGEEYIFKAHQF